MGAAEAGGPLRHEAPMRNHPQRFHPVLACSCLLLLGCPRPEPSWEACPCLSPEGRCAPPPCTGTAPDVSEAVRIVPSDGLPAQVPTQDANNNLDVALHAGRLYLAFRTAPSHFAAPEAELYVVSTTDEQHWRYEARFHLGTDLREPRLLAWDGRLFLYFAVLGDDMLAFEPQGMMVSELRGPGDFTAPEWFYGEEFIPWRARVVDDVPYLIVYSGGAGIYTGGDPEPLEVHWLTTTDGRTFEPVVPGQPIVLTGGTSETDFAFAPDGALIAVSRNEEGDETGWGSKICRAEPEDLSTWSCVTDPRKYDSPLVFSHEGRIYLIGRRHLSEDGLYDLFLRDLTPEEQTQKYQIEYWYHPKRCSLWEVDPDTLEVAFVLDLPSRGDTCFAQVVPLDEPGLFRVYNYSSPVEGPDLDWIAGQTQPTHIYAATLSLPVPLGNEN